MQPSATNIRPIIYLGSWSACSTGSVGSGSLQSDLRCEAVAVRNALGDDIPPVVIYQVGDGDLECDGKADDQARSTSRARPGW